MKDLDFIFYEFDDEDFIKDYKKTSEILDELTVKSMKKSSKD